MSAVKWNLLDKWEFDSLLCWSILPQNSSGWLSNESVSVISRTTRHGTPTASEFGGMSLVTTLPAPITQPSPIVTPPHMVTFPAIQQLLPIVIGLAYSLSVGVPSCFTYWFLSCQRSGCIGVRSDTFGPKNTLSPIVTGQQSTQVKLNNLYYGNVHCFQHFFDIIPIIAYCFVRTPF